MGFGKSLPAKRVGYSIGDLGNPTIPVLPFLEGGCISTVALELSLNASHSSELKKPWVQPSWQPQLV